MTRVLKYTIDSPNYGLRTFSLVLESESEDAHGLIHFDRNILATDGDYWTPSSTKTPIMATAGSFKDDVDDWIAYQCKTNTNPLASPTYCKFCAKCKETEFQDTITA